MATTVQNALNDVLAILNDPTVTTTSMTTGNGWTGNELFGYLKEGLRLLAKRTRAYRGAGTITLVAGTAAYALPSGCIEPVSILIGTNKLVRVTLAELDARDASWESDTGLPEEYCLDYEGFGRVLFYRKPDAATVASYPTAKVRYIKTPTIPTALTDTIDIPDHHANALVYYTLARAYQKDGEMQNEGKVATYLQLFEAFVRAMSADAIAGFDRTPRSIPYRNF